MSWADFDPVEITDVISFENGFVIRWVCPHIGFGEYTIRTKVKRNELGFAVDGIEIEGDSEHMDCNEDKSFLIALLKKLSEKINIIS